MVWEAFGRSIPGSEIKCTFRDMPSPGTGSKNRSFEARLQDRFRLRPECLLIGGAPRFIIQQASHPVEDP